MQASDLAELLPTLRSRITKYRRDKRFNEQSTKVSLIVPVLQALGWNTDDPEDVQWGYKRNARDNPVDFALLLQRVPCLLLEAETLREDLDQEKQNRQLLSYASVAGVEWVALSNGDEYRLLNAGAAVSVEEKLFRSISIARSNRREVVATLALLSKQSLQANELQRVWESHLADRRVGSALEELLNRKEPASTIVRAIRRSSKHHLTDSTIRSALRRARIQVGFSEAPEAEAPQRERQPPPSDRAPAKRRVSLKAIIAEGLLRVPAQVHREYKGHELTATIDGDASITYGGTRYYSLSLSAAMARKPLFDGHLGRRPYPQTNGWTFWRFREPGSQELIPLDLLRERYLEKRGQR